MATSITLATGPLTATLSTADDTAAQQKLEHVAHALTEYMIRVARDRYIQEESANIQEDAKNNVHW